MAPPSAKLCIALGRNGLDSDWCSGMELSDDSFRVEAATGLPPRAALGHSSVSSHRVRLLQLQLQRRAFRQQQLQRLALRQ